MDPPSQSPVERKPSCGPDSSLAFCLQALLLRHEEYTANAEGERGRMVAKMMLLEASNTELEASNALLVGENTALRSRVDSQGTGVNEDHRHNESLTAALECACDEGRKVAALSSRTETLETQLLALEAKQTHLLSALARSEEQERAITQRWRITQDEVVVLQSKLEALERTRNDVSFNNEEGMTTAKRKRAVEREDYTAREAWTYADSQALQHHTPMLSKFVQEVLQDNASLQITMTGQQESLTKLHEEVESLRKRLSFSHPWEHPNEEYQRQPSLFKDSHSENRPTQKVPEVHVHHHYHAPPSKQLHTNLGRSKSQNHARPKKRKVTTSHERAVSIAHYPSLPLQDIPNNNRDNATPYEPTPLSPTPTTSRFSASSTQTRPLFPLSSNPSSPHSTIFERPEFGDEDLDISRPTSRGSSVIWLPDAGDDENEEYQGQPSIERKLSPTPKPLASKEPLQATLPRIRRHSQKAENILPHSSARGEVRCSPALTTNKTCAPTITQPIPIIHPRQLQYHRTPSNTSLVSISVTNIHASLSHRLSSSSSFKSISTSSRQPTHPHPFLAVSTSPTTLTAATASTSSSTVAARATSSSRVRISKRQEPMTTGTALSRFSARMPPRSASTGIIRGETAGVLGEDNGVGKRGHAGEKEMADNVEGYAPLADTFGKTVGSWLSRGWSSGGVGAVGPMKTIAKEDYEAPGLATQTANLPRLDVKHPNMTSSSRKHTPAQYPPRTNYEGGRDVSVPQRPAMAPRFESEVDEEALRECLEEVESEKVSEVSGGMDAETLRLATLKSEKTGLGGEVEVLDREALRECLEEDTNEGLDMVIGGGPIRDGHNMAAVEVM